MARSKSPEIQLYPEQPTVPPSSRFNVGVELTGPQLRIATLSTGVEPHVAGNNAFLRTGMVCVGQHAWAFQPEMVAGSYAISADKAEEVTAVLKEFLLRLEIDQTQVDRIAVGGVITYDKDRDIVRVSNDQLQDRLDLEFRSPEIIVGSRTRAALNAERVYGAGKDYPQSRRLLYLRISETINVDAGDGRFEWSGDRIFARRFRHAKVDRTRLEMYLSEFLGGQFGALEPTNCAVCGESDCLHSFASGQGILDRLPESAVDAVEQAHRAGGNRFAHGDLGAQAKVAGREVYSAAVFRGGASAVLRPLVAQAGVAIGIALNDHVLGVYEPDLIVVDGTVPIGSSDEDYSLLENRQTVDGFIQRTLSQELKEQYPRLHLTVTRSRFAGFTGLLGLMAPNLT